mmetsp:Transcript_59925/g.104827  ORF Transcript_59925/g.104827 Transcript_59925/m.104827 type:complete len:243 (+) Transcript_59925:79-807(+)
MAHFQAAELLGVGVAAILASIFWADSAAVRASLVAVAGVISLYSLAPLWSVPVQSKSKCAEDELSDSRSASAAHFVSAAITTVRNTLGAVPRKYFLKSAPNETFMVCTVAVVSWATVKAFALPGYPWNGILLGALLSWCYHKFSSGVQSELPKQKVCQCGGHTSGDASCPYNANFWDFAPPSSLPEDDESSLQDFPLGNMSNLKEEKENALREDVETTMREDMESKLQEDLANSLQEYDPYE